MKITKIERYFLSSDEFWVAIYKRHIVTIYSLRAHTPLTLTRWIPLIFLRKMHLQKFSFESRGTCDIGGGP